MVATVAALLATAGLAAAQQASFSVSLEPQDDAGELSPGDSTQVSVLVRLEGDGFSCAEDEELPVTLSVAESGGVSGAADPDELAFSNTQGIHSSGSPAGGYNESSEASVTVEVAETASAGDRDLAMTGTFEGGNYAPPEGSCDGEFPSAEGTASIPVTIQTDSAAGGDGGASDGGAGNGTDGGTDGDDGDDGEDGNGIPFGPWLAPVALGFGAVALRRR